MLVMSNEESVRLASWDRFHTRNLIVVPELLGQSHVFTFDEREVTILLPGADKLPDEPGGDDTLGQRLSFSGWRLQDGQQQIRKVHVHNVDVTVCVPGNATIPGEALVRPVKAPELFSEHQQKYLDKLLSENGDISRRAFKLWIRTLRRKADNWRIGLPEVYGEETGWSTYLQVKDTQKAVWAGTHISDVPAEKAVTPTIWDETWAALCSGQPSPIFYDLLYDAMAHLDHGDLQRTVLDAAISAETYMRIIVRQGLPQGLDDPLQTYINDANIRQVANKFFPARLDTQEKRRYKTIASTLHRMFDDRNAIAHSGYKDGLTTRYCQKIIDSVHTLLSLAPYRSTNS
jgi:hypothetical protein